MKKFMFAAVAIFAIFALVGCGDDSSGGGGGGGGTTPEKYTISYDANGYDGTGVPTTTKEVTIRSKLSTVTGVFPALTDKADGTKAAIGWGISKDDTAAQVNNGDYVPTADITLFVISADIIATGSPIAITYDINNWPVANPTLPTPGTVNSGSAVGTAAVAVLTDASGTYIFEGWTAPAKDSPIVTSTSIFKSNVTFFAKWKLDQRVFFEYTGTPALGTVELDVVFGETTLGEAVDSLDAKRDVMLDQSKGFRRWVVKDAAQGATPPTTATVINAKTTYVAEWWDATFDTTSAVGAEKAYLENGSTLIFEFDISGKDLANIKSISASYQLSEYMIKEAGTRSFRTFGPYFYNSDPVVIWTGTETDPGWSAGTVLYGDFAMDRNGSYIAKFNGNGAYNADDMRKYNKFHPYFIANPLGGWLGPEGSTDNPWDKSGILDIIGTGNTIEAKKWFTATVPLSSAQTGDQVYGRALKDVMETKGELWPVDTDMTKVYFGVGLFTTQQDGSGGDIGYERFQGVTQLIKDVTITFTDNTTVTGVKPSFGNGNVFAGYLPAGYVWSARGDATDPVAFPEKVEDTDSESCICTAAATTSCGKANCRNALTFCKDYGCAVAGKTATTYGDLECTKGPAGNKTDPCTDCTICTAAGRAVWACTCAACLADVAGGGTVACICTEDNCTSQLAGGDCGMCPVCWFPKASEDFTPFKVGVGGVSAPLKNATAFTGTGWNVDQALSLAVTFPAYTGTKPTGVTGTVNFDLRSYSSFTVVAKFFDKNGDEIPVTGTNAIPGSVTLGNVKFCKDITDVTAGDATIMIASAQVNGLGQGGTTKGTIPGTALQNYSDFVGLVFQTQGSGYVASLTAAGGIWETTSGEYIEYIEVSEVTFHK